MAKQRRTAGLGRPPGTLSWAELREKAGGFLTTSPQAGARKRQTFPEPISNQRRQSRPQPRVTHDPSQGLLQGLHLTSPLAISRAQWKGGHPSLRDPTPSPGPGGPGRRGQGWGSGNPLPALGSRLEAQARAKGRSKQSSHGAGGPATGVLSHPAPLLGGGSQEIGKCVQVAAGTGGGSSAGRRVGGGAGETQP